MIFREASLLDVQPIMTLVQQRIDWMNQRGLHQWNETDYFGRYPQAYWERNISSFLVGEERRVVVAIALYREDVRWHSVDHRQDAYYLHHLVTAPTHPGAGRAMMLYVEQYAWQHGINLLRLDSAVGNSKLEQFYTALGYQPCGTCQDRLYSGVLRQKKLSIELLLSAKL